jgi:hypothetical protein
MREKQSNHSINSILHTAKNNMATIITKVSELKLLNGRLSKILARNLAKHCQVANCARGVLTLMIDSSAWSTRIRYVTTDILQELHKDTQLQHITTIKCIVRPKYQQAISKNKTRHKPRITLANIRLMQETARNIKKGELQEALLRFGTKSKS